MTGHDARRVRVSVVEVSEEETGVLPAALDLERVRAAFGVGVGAARRGARTLLGQRGRLRLAPQHLVRFVLDEDGDEVRHAGVVELVELRLDDGGDALGRDGREALGHGCRPAERL